MAAKWQLCKQQSFTLVALEGKSYNSKFKIQIQNSKSKFKTQILVFKIKFLLFVSEK